MKKLMFLILLIPTICFCQIPSTENLKGIHFFDSQHGIIVTESGKMYQTLNSGYLWTSMPTITNSFIRYFAQADANTYFITGYNGTLLKSTDNGFSWTLMNCGTNIQLTQIAFTDLMTGYLLGANGYARKSVDGGNTWVQMNVPTSSSLTSVCFINDSVGFIGCFGYVFKTFNAGLSWAPVIVESTAISFQDIFFTDDLHGVAVGYNGTIYITFNGGNNWLQSNSGTSENLYDVHFSTNNTGFIVGKNGTMLRTANGGLSWNTVNISPFVSIFSMIEFTNGLSGYMVADNGHVYYTADSGYTWFPTPPPALNINNGNTNSLEISYYTNPVSENLIIGINSIIPDVIQINLIDISGRCILPSRIEYIQKGENHIQIPNIWLTKGWYILNIQSSNFNYNKKIFVL